MLAICTPVYRQVEADFLTSLSRSMELGGIRWLHVKGHANLARSRNYLVQEARDRGADQIVFIDSDIGWEPEALGQLFDCPEECRVVAGAPQRRDDGVIRFCSMPDRIMRREGQLISGIGATAFMRIAASVFDELESKVPAYAYQGKQYPAFFQTPVQDGELLDEDVFFSRLCKANGIEVWLNPEIPLRHWHHSPLTAVMAEHVKFKPLREAVNG